MRIDLPDPKKIVAVFVLLGLVWIYLSGELIYLIARPSAYLDAEIMKGFFFILVTAALLFYLLEHYQKKVKQSLELRQKSEANFKRLYEESPQPMWISDENKNVLFMNKSALQLFEFSAGPPAVLPEEISVADGQQLPWSFLNGEGEEAQGVRQFASATGKVLYLDLMVQPIEYEQKLASLVMAGNVTRLVKVEKERVRISNELVHYKKALDRSALLSVTDINGVILDVNAKFCEVSGYSREELLGNSHNLVKSGYHSEAFFRRLYKTVRSGEMWRGEVCNQAKDGSLFWVDLAIVPVQDEFNGVHRYMAIAYPVTDRKVAELRSEKIHQELMTFMYKASHNLRGPVATLSGLLNIAAIEVKEAFSLNYIRMLEERTRHLEFVLNELIAITKIKQEDLSIGLVDIQGLVEQVCSAFEEDFRKHQLRLECKFNLDKPFYNDEKLLRGLLFYLLDNTVKFRSNNDPKVIIEVKTQAQGILLSVADNGPGISESIRDRIYEMYFRGHEKSTGSGLGLYIVSSIVERLGGYISLKSQMGLGSTFSVYLPDAQQAGQQKNSSSGLFLKDRKAKRVKTDS